MEDIKMSYEDMKLMYKLITGCVGREKLRSETYMMKGMKYSKEIVNLQFKFFVSKYGIQTGLKKFCKIYELPYVEELIERIFNIRIESTSNFLAHYLKYMKLKQYRERSFNG